MNLNLDPDVAGADLARDSSALAQLVDRDLIADMNALHQAKHDRERLGGAMDKVRAFFAQMKQDADKLHKGICQRERQLLQPLQAADARLRQAIADYTRQQDAQRRQLERDQEEQQRREREQRAIHEAAALETQGDQAAAAAVLADALDPAPSLSVALPDPVREVVSLTRYYRWRYAGGPNDRDQTSPDVLRRAVGLVPRDFLIVDEKKLNTYARAMKDTASVAGIEFYYVDLPNR